MKVASFKIVFITLALNAFLPKQVALGRKASSTSEAMSILSRCPQSKCLTDAVSCLAGAQYSVSHNSGMNFKLLRMEKKERAFFMSFNIRYCTLLFDPLQKILCSLFFLRCNCWFNMHTLRRTWRGSLSTWRLLLPAEEVHLQEELVAVGTK
ncbi:unnamed protein product [Porites lobata]|uniref:Uncharacterized protein n=1 Tax=Porites lobata TaxID=104759 RepID=A0ABN8MTP9_9CNID|nr:unnamed protein product [Porites lobata]